MKAMILAAGFGKRMGELTKTIPKPLLKVGQYSLIEHLILKLKKQGIHDIVINASYLAKELMAQLGNGQAYGVSIHFSVEENEPLEWGGGVLKALPLLGKDPFIALSGDLWTDYPFAQLYHHSNSDALAHLVMIDHHDYHADFALQKAYVSLEGQHKMTYGGIGLFHPELFAGFKLGKISFRDIVFPAVKKQKITGEIYSGTWVNVTTSNCLAQLQEKYLTEDIV